MKQIVFFECKVCHVYLSNECESEKMLKFLSERLYKLHLANYSSCKNQEFELFFDKPYKAHFIYKVPQMIKNNPVIAEQEKNKLIIWLKGENHDVINY